jgi:Ca2+-binding EF-hand superfamily protein
MSAEHIIERMRAQLKKRGAEGLRGLARNFKICDTNGSGQLDFEELAKCCKLCKLNLQPYEVEELLNFFDSGASSEVRQSCNNPCTLSVQAHL